MYHFVCPEIFEYIPVVKQTSSTPFIFINSLFLGESVAKKQREAWKVYNNVFDQFTFRTLEKLRSKGLFDELKSTVALGKEANVFTALRGEETVCLKIYRLQACDFNRMYEYIRLDPRFSRLQHQRRKVIFGWTQREYRNLLKAREGGIRSPTVYGYSDHVLLMEFIGDPVTSRAAPLLKELIPHDPEKFFAKVVENMRLLWKNKLVHGDLSHYNILNYDEEPVFIDFSHATTEEVQNYRELWIRDCATIARFFAKLGVKTDAASLYTKITGKKLP